MTRGIRVELVSTVLLCAFGIMSQAKIWKVIQKRKQQKALEREAAERQRDELEEGLGRRIEAGNERDRSQWEAVYGDRDRSDKQLADSGIGTNTDPSIHKDSYVETKELDPETIEMGNLRSSDGSNSDGSSDGGKVNEKFPAIIRIAEDDLVPGRSVALDDSETTRTKEQVGTLNTTWSDNSKEVTRQSTSCFSEDGQANHATVRLARNSPPRLMPLPFQIHDTEDDDKDDSSSVATFASSQHLRDRKSNRYSGSSLLRKFSSRSKRQSIMGTTSEEALVIPRATDDAASSVAATMDDIEDDRSHGDDRSSAGKATIDVRTRTLSKSSPLSVESPKDAGTSPVCAEQAVAQDLEPQNRNDNDLSSPPSTSRFEIPSKVAGPSRFCEGSTDQAITEVLKVEGTTEQRPTIVRSAVEAPNAPYLPVNLEGRLPEAAPRVVTTFRTNEWAKHLENAEAPELETISSAVKQTGDIDKVPEAVTPVRVHELQQTPTSAEAALNLYSFPQPSTTPRSPSDASRTSGGEYQVLRQASLILPTTKSSQNSPYSSSLDVVTKQGSTRQQISRSSSQQSLAPPKSSGLRSSSSPLLASPIEEGKETFFQPNPAPTPLPSTTLMGQRSTMIHNKSFNSLTPTARAPTPHILGSSGPGASAESLSNRISAVTSATTNTSIDDLTLSQRRSMLYPHHPQLLSSRSSSHLSNPYLSYSQRSLIDPALQRESQLASFRSSLQQDMTSQAIPVIEAEHSRVEMIHEKRRESVTARRVSSATQMREGMYNAAMRRGDMREAHREAMRRMQGEANRHL